MGRIEALVSRLPQLYRDGELIADVLELAALQLEVLDEDAREVQRAHWFDAALELEEAAGLAAVLDIAPEPWQNLGEFRAWLHSLRNAMLRGGAVTVEALQGFVADYTRRYQAVVGVRAVPPITTWSETPSPGEPGFIETPLRRRYDRAPTFGGIEPLHRFSLEQKGLDETLGGFLLVGLPSAPESVPVIVNLTTGQALLFLGNIPPGARLWIRPTQDGGVDASLEGEDVNDRMRSVSGIEPGTPWSNAKVEEPARGLTLARGKNDLWFLPVAHFDALGLDRFLLALADLLLRQGRYDETAFDQALFYQPPAVVLRVTWVETQPASFEIHLPAGSLLNPPNGLDRALQDRDRLGYSLNQAVQKLKAAGVAAEVQMRPFLETQGQMDRLTAVLPLTNREVGPSGADRLPDAGGVFEVTDFNDSTFR